MRQANSVKKTNIKEYSQTVYPESDGFERGVHPRATRIPFGHDTIIEHFCKAYAEKRAAKSYLFLGAKGTGKATLTYALIRGIIRAEAENRPLTKADILSDAQDAVYRKILALSYPNLKVLRREYDFDSKTDRQFKTVISAEDTRKIKDFLHFKPQGNGARFCIIDSAEDILKNQAASANALLKPIEEPPQNCYFFIIAHSLGSAPATVRSRCETVRFFPLSAESMRAIMCGSPAFSGLNETEIDLIIQSANGSIRSAAIYTDKRKLQYAHTLKALLRTGGEARSAFSRIYLDKMLAEKDYLETLRAIRIITLAVTAECARDCVYEENENFYASYRLSALFFELRNLLTDTENYNFPAIDFYDALCGAINLYIFERKARVDC